jgi:hypothetical protein
MPKISNDHDLRDALSALSADQQRFLGARFVQSVLRLSTESRVGRAVETALDAEAGDDELEDAFRAAKSHATKTYAECGRDTNWLAQADHFVAAAAVAALTPESLMPEKGSNRAWKAAVQARMAVNCASMEEEAGATESEMERQYRIAEDFLGS